MVKNAIVVGGNMGDVGYAIRHCGTMTKPVHLGFFWDFCSLKIIHSSIHLAGSPGFPSSAGGFTSCLLAPAGRAMGPPVQRTVFTMVFSSVPPASEAYDH